MFPDIWMHLEVSSIGSAIPFPGEQVIITGLQMAFLSKWLERPTNRISTILRNERFDGCMQLSSSTFYLATPMPLKYVKWHLVTMKGRGRNWQESIYFFCEYVCSDLFLLRQNRSLPFYIIYSKNKIPNFCCPFSRIHRALQNFCIFKRHFDPSKLSVKVIN